MIDIPATPRLARLAASVLGVALIAALGISAPFTVDSGGLSMREALAGRGGGNGGGRGGGHDHGHGSGGGMSASASDLSGASGAAAGAHGNRAGKAPASVTSDGDGPSDNSAAATGETAMSLGSLNAAHASETAFANASEDSVVGKLSAYMEDIKAYLDSLDGSEDEQNAALEAAAADLADAANKDELLDAETIDALNTLLDGKADGFTHDAVDGDPVHDAEPAIADLVNPPPAE